MQCSIYTMLTKKLKKSIKSSLRLFLTAFLQVGLVAINVFQIANQHYVGAVIVGFGISFLWTFNVKRIAFSNLNNRILYSLGAALGTLTGIIISKFLLS